MKSLIFPVLVGGIIVFGMSSGAALLNNQEVATNQLDDLLIQEECACVGGALGAYLAGGLSGIATGNAGVGIIVGAGGIVLHEGYHAAQENQNVEHIELEGTTIRAGD